MEITKQDADAFQQFLHAFFCEGIRYSQVVNGDEPQSIDELKQDSMVQDHFAGLWNKCVDIAQGGDDENDS
jgi:hypothetical protein